MKETHTVRFTIDEHPTLPMVDVEVDVEVSPSQYAGTREAPPDPHEWDIVDVTVTSVIDCDDDDTATAPSIKAAITDHLMSSTSFHDRVMDAAGLI